MKCARGDERAERGFDPLFRAEVQTVLVGFEQQKFYSADRIAFLEGKGLKNPVIAISVEKEADFSELNPKNNNMKQ